MRRVLFLDLDDSILQSRRKVPEEDAELVAVDSAGVPCSFMSRRRRAFYEWISTGAEVIPVTGRSVEALSRVKLHFSSWVICSFGGVLLAPDRSLEPRWHALIRQRAGVSQEPLERGFAEVQRALAQACPSARARIVWDAELPLYIAVRCAREDAEKLALMQPVLSELCPPGWRVYRNDHQLVILPDWLGKEHAVRWFQANILEEAVVSIGVGDSDSDVPFLSACDFALSPSDAQLWRTLSRALAARDS